METLVRVVFGRSIDLIGLRPGKAGSKTTYPVLIPSGMSTGVGASRYVFASGYPRGRDVDWRIERI